MSEGFLPIDHVPEAELPAHASDGKSGDRVSLLEAGLLHVEGGRATLVPWRDVLGVLERGGEAIVLVPRRPPREPWVSVRRELLGDAPDAVRAFAARVRERSASGGYRDAVRQRRQGLAPAELIDKVREREPVPGALEVPSTIYLGRLGHPLEGLVLFGMLGGAWALGFAATILVGVAAGAGRLEHAELVFQILGFLPYVFVLAAAFAAVRVRKAWRAARQAELPRQRVLVLAPDGCVVGFRTGVRALAWSEVGGFEIGPTEPDYNDGLVVRDLDGKKLGDIDAGWLAQPLSLVVDVAETYRDAAR